MVVSAAFIFVIYIAVFIGVSLALAFFINKDAVFVNAHLCSVRSIDVYSVPANVNTVAVFGVNVQSVVKINAVACL